MQEVQHIPRRDRGDSGRRDGADRMIHALQDEHPQVAQIAGHEISHDLPAAVFERLVAAGKPFQ
ncbi:MAG TPA: hypothetical protein VII35_16380 [Steroidobacteraceae bacterium]